MPDFRLPDLGEGLTEAEIVTWLVQVGDVVEIDQTVVEVETAKASVEVPCPYAGTVTTLHAQAGQSIAVGAVLISIAAVRDAAAGDAPVEAGSADGSGTAAAESGASGSVLIGYGTGYGGTAGAPRRVRALRRGRTAHAVQEQAGAIGVVSPLVRRMARDAGVDLASIAGRGPDGLILRRDVDRAIADRASVAAERESKPPTVPMSAAPDPTRIAIRGVRRAIADKMTRSRREIPEATVWVDVDATALLAARAGLNRGHPDDHIGITALVARFAVLGLARFPELNARIEGDEIVLLPQVNLGFAAQTERGLLVPVITDAQAMSTEQLSRSLSELTRSARDGRLGLPDLTGGTFTVNNYGMFGVDGSAAIINFPEVAILGVGRIIDRPWVVDGEITVRSLTQLTLAFDHRVGDGQIAGGFLRFVADCIEAPVSALRFL